MLMWKQGENPITFVHIIIHILHYLIFVVPVITMTYLIITNHYQQISVMSLRPFYRSILSYYFLSVMSPCLVHRSIIS